MTLNSLAPGQSAVIRTVGGEGALRQHFLDMGVIPGAQITLVKFAPMGDPIEFRIHSYELTLRVDDAKQIEISAPCSAESDPPCPERLTPAEHPGLGEGGRYHVKAGERPLPDGTLLTFALAGNQNCGKTTLFNQLTGSNQHVGNFPGVTVDRKDGVIRDHADTLVTDLPGIYSMSPLHQRGDRHPALCARGQAARHHQHRGRHQHRAQPVSDHAAHGAGCADGACAQHDGRGARQRRLHPRATRWRPCSAFRSCRFPPQRARASTSWLPTRCTSPTIRSAPAVTDFCDPEGHAGRRPPLSARHHAPDRGPRRNARASRRALPPASWPRATGSCSSSSTSPKTKRRCSNTSSCQMEQERGLDRAAAIADMRFSFIEKVCSQTVVRPHESREHARSVKARPHPDRQIHGHPACSSLIMLAVFYLTFNVIGSCLSDLLDAGIGALTTLVDRALVSARLLRRAAFPDYRRRVQRRGQRAQLPADYRHAVFLPLHSGGQRLHGARRLRDGQAPAPHRSFRPQHRARCSSASAAPSPAVMATRTLPSERDRKMTILLTPFMSCSAKLPIYAFFTAVVLPAAARCG